MLCTLTVSKLLPTALVGKGWGLRGGDPQPLASGNQLSLTFESVGDVFLSPVYSHLLALVMLHRPVIAHDRTYLHLHTKAETIKPKEKYIII